MPGHPPKRCPVLRIERVEGECTPEHHVPPTSLEVRAHEFEEKQLIHLLLGVISGELRE